MATIPRRESGYGVVPNPIPRATAFPNHGLAEREWFSSQLSIQGQSFRGHTYPINSPFFTLIAVKYPHFRSAGTIPVVKSLFEFGPGYPRRLILSPLVPGAFGHVNSAPRFKRSCLLNSFG